VWPPFEGGNQAARTHGVWAKDVDEEAAEVLHALYPPELAARFPAAAALGAQVWVRRRRALADIDSRGLVIEDGKGGVRANPLLQPVTSWENTLLRIANEFGLTPRSEAELVRDRAVGALDVSMLMSSYSEDDELEDGEDDGTV
jgi:hypothetical protein